MISGIIFDMDGVIIDSEQLWDQARGEQVRAWGGRWDEQDQRNVMGHNSFEWARYIQSHCGIARDEPTIIAAVVDRLLGLYKVALPLLPGAVPAVQAFGARLPLGVASSAPRRVIEHVLAAAGIAPLFRAVVSSDEVAVGKPAPDVYLEAARRMGLAPATCLVFEDSSSGLRAAAAAGMRVVALPNAHYPPAPEALALASASFPSLAAVPLTIID